MIEFNLAYCPERSSNSRLSGAQLWQMSEAKMESRKSIVPAGREARNARNCRTTSCGSGSLRRHISYGKAVKGILDAQRMMCMIEGSLCEYVFPTEKGRPIMPNTYHNTIQTFARAVDIEISIHELRHTFVSISAKGMELNALQAI